MTKQKIEGLLCDIAEHTLDYPASEQQKQLLAKLSLQMQGWAEGDAADPDIMETFKLLLLDFEGEHPKTAAAIHEVLDALAKMGI